MLFAMARVRPSFCFHCDTGADPSEKINGLNACPMLIAKKAPSGTDAVLKVNSRFGLEAVIERILPDVGLADEADTTVSESAPTEKGKPIGQCNASGSACNITQGHPEHIARGFEDRHSG